MSKEDDELQEYQEYINEEYIDIITCKDYEPVSEGLLSDEEIKQLVAIKAERERIEELENLLGHLIDMAKIATERLMCKDWIELSPLKEAIHNSVEALKEGK